MDVPEGIQFLILLLLIFLSGFFSSAETAFSTVNRVRLRSLEEEGNKRAAKVSKILESYSKMLSTILIGNNIVNLSTSALTTTIALRFGVPVAVATGVLTLVLLLCGEIVPKTWAMLSSEKIALAYCGIIYGLAVTTGASRITIVLAGVAVSGFFGAGSDAITTLVPDAWTGASTFLVGGFSGVTFQNIRFSLWYIAGGLVLALLLCHDMNILALGEETAQSLGLSVRLCRLLFIVTAAVLAGGAVSSGGLMGFVGLIVPHAARFLVGEDNRRLIPASALLGASFVLGCDLLARVLFAPYELPVGILLNFLGGPFFLWLLLRQRRHRR